MNRSLSGGMLVASLLLIRGVADGAYPQGQAVTYSDFSYIHQVAGSSERVYFATTEGIIRYNQIERRWEEPLTGSPGITQGEVERIWVDQFGQDLVAQVFDGLFEYDEALDTWFPTTETPEESPFVRHVPPPPIMHAPPGFNYLGGGELIDQYGRYWRISDILDDGSGTNWIATWGYGAAKAQSTNLIIDLLPFGLLQRRVNVLVLDDGGRLWMGGAVIDQGRTGITVFDPVADSFHYIESGVRAEFPAIDINCVEADEDYLYVGTPWGLYIIDRETEEVERTVRSRDGLTDENVLSVAVNGDSVLIGTSEGLNMVEREIDSVAHIYPTTLAGERIWDVEVIGEHIWVGAGSGAYRVTPGPASLQRYTDDESVLFSDVYDIERWGDKLWFVSDAGLVELDLKTAESRSFHDIAQRVTPRALAVNGSIAAVASDKGLTFYFLEDDKPYKREFTTQDGLASNLIFALALDGDYLWIGTDKGLTRFLWNNPDRVD